ncbi:MAG: GNAT family N-acetyltransferase [Lysinibacillus sp.]
MRIIHIWTRVDLAYYKELWDSILALQKNDNPFIEYAWFDMWWDVLGRSEPVKVYAVEHNDEIVAFFPFIIRKKWGVHIVSNPGEGVANYTGFVAKPEWLAPALKFVLDELQQSYQHIVFSYHGLLESQQSSKELEQYVIEKQKSYNVFRVVTPFLSFDRVDFPALHKNAQKMHGGDQHEKKLQQLGELSYQTSNLDELGKMLKLFDRRWSKKVGISHFNDGRKREFFERLAHVKDEAIQIEVDTLVFEHRWLAFAYGISCRNRYVVYALGHEPYFKQFGPEHFVYQEAMKRTYLEDYKLFDLSIGSEPYKLDWHSGIDFTRKVIVNGGTRRAQSLFHYITMKERLKEKLKNNRYVGHLKRNVLGTWQRLWKQGKLTDWVQYVKEVVGQVFRYDQVDVYELQVENFPDFRRKLVGTLFDKLPIQQVMKEESLAAVPYYYEGYTIYKEKYMETCQIAFCLHEETWEIAALQMTQPLQEDTIFIDHYAVKNFPMISAFLRNNYAQKSQLTTLQFWQWKKKRVLRDIGFQRIARVKQLKCLRYERKFSTIQTLDGGKQHSYN